MFKVSKKYYPFAANDKGEILNTETGKIRKQTLCKNGYLYVGSRQFLTTVHSIVADAWLDPPYRAGLEINHKNGIKTDNRPSNLEWVTRSENMKHAAQNNLLDTTNRKRGEDCNLTNFSEAQIREACELLQDGWRNVDVARKVGMRSSYVKDLRAKRSWKHVTEEYTFPERQRQKLSENTVRWVCEKISKGCGNTDILKMSTNPNLRLSDIKNIKYKKCYASIANEYF